MCKRDVLRSLVLVLGLIFVFYVSSCFAEESITITTYYPSPSGVYNRLQTNSLGVGDNNNNYNLDSGDVPTTAGDVWINGSVGIGMTSPAQKLDVAGQIHATGDICTDLGRGRCLNTTGTPLVSIAYSGWSLVDTGWATCPAGYTAVTCTQEINSVDAGSMHANARYNRSADNRSCRVTGTDDQFDSHRAVAWCLKL